MKRDFVLEQLVIEEATNLKKYATKKELKKLDYNSLNGDDPKNCIYGKATGHCGNERSYKLIRLCATRVYNITNENYSITTSVLNGPPEKLQDYSQRLSTYFSPIEKLLFRYKPSVTAGSNKIKRLVNFLQGKTDTLTF